MGLNGHMGPLRGHNPIFFQIFSYSSIVSINRTKGFWGIIFNLKPLNGHYSYTPVFPNAGAKEGKTPQKGFKKNSVPHFSGLKHFKTLKPIYFTIEKIY